MDISSLTKVSVNNYMRTYGSPLVYWIDMNYLQNIEHILALGGNPNGETSNGTPYITPLSRAILKHNKYTTLPILKTLLKNGADINYIDIKGDTVLTVCTRILINNFDKEDTYNFIKDIFIFLLDKGANPDGTIFNNPLYILLECIKIKRTYNLDKLISLITILIAYGANTFFNFIILNEGRDNLKYNAKQCLIDILEEDLSSENDSIDIHTQKRIEDDILPLFNFNINKILSKDNINDILLHKLAIYHKIDEEYLHSSKKELVSFILNKRSKEYNEEKDIETRKEKKNIIPFNEDTLLGYSIYSFTNNELIYLYEKEEYEYNTTERDKVYIFHTSEIPILLKNKSNPYTNTPLPSYFIDDLINRYKYNECYILEECLDKKFYNKDKTKLDNEVLLNFLIDYVKKTHPYINGNKFLSLSLLDMIELQDVIFNKNIFLLRNNITRYDREVNKLFITDNVKDRITNRTLTIIFKYLQNINNIEQQYRINNSIEQIIHEQEFRIEILNKLSILRNPSMLIVIPSFTSFLEYISSIVNLSDFTSDIREVIHQKYPLVNLSEDLNDYNKDFYYTEYIKELFNTTTRSHNIFFDSNSIEDWRNLINIIVVRY